MNPAITLVLAYIGVNHPSGLSASNRIIAIGHCYPFLEIKESCKPLVSMLQFTDSVPNIFRGVLTAV